MAAVASIGRFRRAEPVAGEPGHRSRTSGGVDLDRDGHAVGQHVEHRGALPRLLDELASSSAEASPFTSKDTRMAW